MNAKLLATLTLLSVTSIALPARADNLVAIQQLLNTRECQQCNLREAGLVLSDLEGVDLQGADLRGANLNRANLQEANLAGANLAGSVLFGADLTGANLAGADLRGVDLREARMTGAILDGANLDGAVMVGAVGLSSEIATAEQLYLWGLAETQRGNFRGAIDYYNQSLALKPDFAHAILARGIARFRLRDLNGAIADGKEAEQLYLSQGDPEGQQLAVRFYEGLEAMQEAMAEGRNSGGGSFLNFLGSLTGLLMQVFF
jgi:uncharacterized protein YjbI with pentapeptide repeats